MSETPAKTKNDPARLLEQFKKSKKVVSTFAEQFQATHGRKPSGEDLSKAPEYVRVCIKNCKRIKAHLEKNSSQVQEKENEVKSPDISEKEPKKAPNSKVWGAHLNRSFSDITNNVSKSGGKVTKIQKTTSYSGTLSALILEDLKISTRKSLLKRSSSSVKKAFFDTMGNDENTTQGIIDEVTTSQDDPLIRFRPELSMDGLSQHGLEKSEEDSSEFEIGNVGGTQPKLFKNTDKTDLRSMSVLTSMKSQKIEATERNFETEIPLNFSGLFSKKRKLDEENDDEDSNDSSKKQKLEEEEDMFADDDEDVETTELLPLEKGDDDEPRKFDKRKPLKPKKIPNGLVSNNFVKIDLKKKNYVRGNKKMTGAKYKRQQWKSKVQTKFGKKR